MSLSKLFRIITGNVNKAAENVIDANAITILEQEQRESKDAVRKAEDALVGIVAKRKMSESKIADFDTAIDDYTKKAISANEGGHEDLALECAQKVADLTAEKEAEQAQLEAFSKAEQTHKANIANARKTITSIDRQLDLVKANDSVQKAQAATQESVIGAKSKTSTALDSLNRIQAKQKENAAKFEAQQELSDAATSSDLDQKLKAAGIGGSTSAQDQLAAILNKSKSAE
ncbi:TPA: PspA/IM30 family protein [Vibrio parahaemolyticus]|uniref:PspA/IM30 family protein n=1 Tax=Vibrio TaxID=662 RepID=UPI001B83C488|nr:MULTISPECIES: PspA/IM30 family protein [Vibrio]BDP38540.1 phage shock protein A [Vibrio alginolyticus]MCR9820079.1 PspA/IM30 family protein [Vibrio parahaemolyticus]BDP33570.1 phage shock protein A [Vibrio vulnificus]HBC3404701.1 PspA/IM30 family protein [Vibrio parahaemolyticus]HBC3540186.1 PspA/IM30 family protein [Vibrio parahaemolyticus]